MIDRDDRLPGTPLSGGPESGARPGTYASGATLKDAGVIAGQDLTPEAALTKLQVLLGRGLHGAALREAMATPLRGEMTARATG